METTTQSSQPQRLLSLDILRGADLAMLVLIQPILFRALKTAHPAEGTIGHFIMGQLSHLPWEGFCFWDIIMPLFMFMSGITIPFAMSRYKRGARIDGQFYWRIIKRFVVLWVLGMVVQGNLLAFDLRQLHLFSNTLQSIAVGYVAVAFLFVFCSLRTQIVAVSLSFMAYIAIFALWGHFDFTIDANICEAIDRAVLGRFRDGVIWQGNQWHWDPTLHVDHEFFELHCHRLPRHFGGLSAQKHAHSHAEIPLAHVGWRGDDCCFAAHAPLDSHHQAHLVYLNDLFVGWNLPFINSVSLLLGRY